MLLHIPQILAPDELESVRSALAGARFVDGKLTAGAAAQRVKNNLELERESDRRALLARALIGSLYRSETFRTAALPHRVSTPIFARYQPGMTYGDHVDDPVMGEGAERYRSDISVTVFLSDPQGYEGGELTIHTTFGERRVKLPAGDAVIYPSSTRHCVEPVTSGERLVMVGWIQSLVRDPSRRELLYELAQARETLLRERPEAAETARVYNSYVNLLRMWSEL